MEVDAEFKNGMCRLFLKPTDEWERLLLGAVAKGGESLAADVTYAPDGHFSYGKCKAVSVMLYAAKPTKPLEEPPE